VQQTAESKAKGKVQKAKGKSKRPRTILGSFVANAGNKDYAWALSLAF
jgi:hypothetical protein